MWPEIHLHSFSSLISAEEPLYGNPLLPFPPSALRLHKDDLSPRCAITIFMLLFLPAWDWKYWNGLTLCEGLRNSSSSLMLLIPSSLLFAFGLSLCALPASLSSPAFSHRVSGAVLKTGKSSAIKLKRPSGEAEDTSDSREGVERREKESKMGGKLDWIFRQIYGSLIAIYLHNLNKCKCYFPLQHGYTVVTTKWHLSSVNMQISQ